MQIFAFQNTARQVAVGETDVYGSVFAVVAVVGRIAACEGVVKAVGVGAAFYVCVVCSYGTTEVVCHDATACYSLLLSFNALVLFLLYVPAYGIADVDALSLSVPVVVGGAYPWTVVERTPVVSNSPCTQLLKVAVFVADGRGRLPEQVEALEPATYIVLILYAVAADVGGLVVLLPEGVVTAAACVAHGVFLNYYPAVCGCVVAVVYAVPLSAGIRRVVQVGEVAVAVVVVVVAMGRAAVVQGEGGDVSAGVVVRSAVA